MLITNLIVRKGNINENPRGGSIGEFVVQIGEGLGVVKAKALNCFRSLLPEADLVSEEIYFNSFLAKSLIFFRFHTKKQHNQLDCQPLNTTTNHSSKIKIITTTKSYTPELMVQRRGL